MAVSPTILIKNQHHSLTSADAVADIIRPFAKPLRLTYFDYCRLYPDGRMSVLTNKAAWVKHFFSANYPAGGMILETGRHMWTANLPKEALLDARESFDQDYGLTVMYQHDEFIEFFDFAATKSFHQILYYYLNQFHLFENFCYYFKDKAKTLIAESIEQPILISANNPPEQTFSQSTDLPCLQTNCYQLQVDGSCVQLGAMETKCLLANIYGMRAKDIALKYGISFRTVEAHIANSKRKLKLTDKHQIKKALTKNFIVPI